MLKYLVYLEFLLVLNQPRVRGFQQLTKNNHFLVGSTFKTVATDEWLSCLQICHEEPTCISYNYKKPTGESDRGLCQLNYLGLEDLCDLDKSLIYSRDFVFQQIRDGQGSDVSISAIYFFPHFSEISYLK